MRPRAKRRAQRGIALVALLTVAVLAFAYVLTSRLNAASQFVGIDREHNAEVLSQAKRALVGWMAINAAGTDNNPGRLPCPEAPGDFNTANEGRAAGNCTLPAVGRLPWRTLGLQKLVDSASEPLWYVVSPGWALPSSSATLTINSDSIGQLSMDGANAVALVIAPGPAMTVLAGGDCAAWSQSRPVTGPPDLRNYLECANATSPPDATFVTAAPGSTFNDQVLRVTAADIVPALEGAIQTRMQREIAPVLRTVYTSSQYSGINAGKPMYPYAAPFANPGTSGFQGAAGTLLGLLPFNQTQGCDPATDPRCTTTLVAWDSATPPPADKIGGYGFILSQTCSWQSSGTVAVCEGLYEEDDANEFGEGILLQMSAQINNVAMGLRRLDWVRARLEARDDDPNDPWVQMPLESTAATLNSNGSVTVTFTARLPNVETSGWGQHAEYRISLERAVIGDHFLLDPATTGPGAATSWFVRNEWYRLIHYAVATNSTAQGLPDPDCVPANCVRYNTTSNLKALLVLTGQSLSNPAGRPNGNLADYLEYANADGDRRFEQRLMRASKVGIPAINAPFNDRLILVDWRSDSPPPLPVPYLP